MQATMQATKPAPAPNAITLTADNAALVLGLMPRCPRVPSDFATLASLEAFGCEGAAVLAALEAA